MFDIKFDKLVTGIVALVAAIVMFRILLLSRRDRSVVIFSALALTCTALTQFANAGPLPLIDHAWYEATEAWLVLSVALGAFVMYAGIKRNTKK